MKQLLKDHELKGRRIRNIETGKTMGIQDVYLMGFSGSQYITLLTYINGSMPPEFRSHSQIDWEMITYEENHDLSLHWKNHIEDNRRIFELIPTEEENKYPISNT